MTKFEEPAGAPTQDNDAKEDPEAEQPRGDGRPLIINEESEADLETQIMDVRCAELQEERGLLEAAPLDGPYAAPAQMITDNSALVRVDEEQRGHLPTWGHPRDSVIRGTYHVPLRSMDEDDSYGLDSGGNCKSMFCG
eukprot:8224341-Pyramimonas_sp.AAC.1